MATSRDPYRYFRVEAQELVEGLTEGLSELAAGAPARSLVGDLLRLAHTLKGAARVVKQAEIAELTHNLEETLASYRDHAASMPRQGLDELSRMLDAIDRRVAALGVPRDRAAGQRSADEPLRTLRLDVRDIDGIIDGLGEVGVSVDALRKQALRLEEAAAVVRALREALANRRQAARADSGVTISVARASSLAEKIAASVELVRHGLSAAMERVERELGQVRDQTHRMRLIPAATIFASMERAASDAAESLGKSVRFEASGGDVQVDADVLTGVRSALLHLVRNAVAHGIEGPAERAAAGKPALGLVQLVVERRGRRIAFSCRDDGRGFDREAIRRAAVQAQVLPPEAAAELSLEQAIGLVLRGGLSTAGAVTAISGRGVGLAAVRDVVSRLKGELNARSEPGRTTTLEVCVPVSLASIPALAVDAAGMVVWLPLDSIVGVLRLRPEEIGQSARGRTVVHQGLAIPFVPLAALLGGTAPDQRHSAHWTAVITQAESARVALGIDGLRGTANVVTQPLPASLPAVRGIAGASFDAEGDPRLMLDPIGLVAAASTRSESADAFTHPQRSRLLVIDDSLATRMVEQSILEAAGYEVDVAGTGEEALHKARERRYALFIVDIEMPGMDGFEFIRRAAGDPELRATPSIIMTTRTSDEDRRRAEKVGAGAYIGKQDFDEAGFVQRIERLIHTP